MSQSVINHFQVATHRFWVCVDEDFPKPMFAGGCGCFSLAVGECGWFPDGCWWVRMVFGWVRLVSRRVQVFSGVVRIVAAGCRWMRVVHRFTTYDSAMQMFFHGPPVVALSAGGNTLSSKREDCN